MGHAEAFGDLPKGDPGSIKLRDLGVVTRSQSIRFIKRGLIIFAKSLDPLERVHTL